MIFANADKCIRYLSYAYQGTCHDFTILKMELQPEKGGWLDHQTVHVDLGYQGIEKIYRMGQLQIPEKKKKKTALSEEQKKCNREKSSFRVKVENSIAGMKRFRFMSDRIRTKNICFYNKVAGISAGLWNFNLTN